MLCDSICICAAGSKGEMRKPHKEELREVGGGGGDWMELAQDRDRWRALVRTVMNLLVP